MKKLAFLSMVLLFAGPAARADDKKDFVPPPVAPPPIFRGTDPNASTNTTSNTTSLGDEKWFEVFKDPQLQALIRVALQQNTDLQTAFTRVAVERANLGITSSAQYPEFSAGGDDSTQELSTHNPNFFPGLEKRSYSFGEALVNLVSFEVDIWGRLRNQTRAAVAQLRASEQDRRSVMTMVVGDVASDYFNLIELDAELAIDQRTLATRNDSLEIIKAREQGGLATLLDVRQGEQLVEQAALTITDTQRQIEQTENNLNLLLGNLPAPVVRGQALTEQQQLPEVPPGLPSSLLERRPDIRSAELNVEAEHFLVSSARAAFFPKITLTGFLGFQSTALTNLFTGGSFEGGVVPSISAPIFNGGRLHSDLMLAKGNQRLALIQYRKTILTAFNEVSNELVQYARVRQLRAQQEQLVATLKDRSDLAYMRYNGGVDTLLNALDADRDLFSAELAVAQSRRNELLALVELYKALGGGWQT